MTPKRFDEIRRMPPLTAAVECFCVLQQMYLEDSLPVEAAMPLMALEDALVRLRKVDRAGLDAVPESVACAECGDTVVPRSRSGRQRRYCSDACRQAAHRARQADLSVTNQS